MLIIPTTDVTLITEATKRYAEDIVGFNPEDWLGNNDNIALTDMFGNVSLFEWFSPGIYTGHYFFVDRGKQAIEIAEAMLARVFMNEDVRVIRGVTPLTQLGARWLSRHLGFKGYGITDTVTGPCEIFILTKEEYLNKGRNRQ